MKQFLLIAILFISFFSSAQTASQEVKWLKHKDTAYNLSIQYPSHWQLKPPSGNSRFFVTSYPESDEDKFRENLNCLIPSPVEEGTTIQQAEEEIVQTLSAMMSEFKIVQSGYSKWNNVNSYQIEYTCVFISGDVRYDLHMLQKAAIINGKLYVLTYSAKNDSYEKYIDMIRKMIDSFKVE
nr:PsbP-related protein [uncultured Lacibacter sp.]